MIYVRGVRFFCYDGRLGGVNVLRLVECKKGCVGWFFLLDVWQILVGFGYVQDFGGYEYQQFGFVFVVVMFFEQVVQEWYIVQEWYFVDVVVVGEFVYIIDYYGLVVFYQYCGVDFVMVDGWYFVVVFQVDVVFDFVFFDGYVQEYVVVVGDGWGDFQFKYYFFELYVGLGCIIDVIIVDGYVVDFFVLFDQCFVLVGGDYVWVGDYFVVFFLLYC